MTAPRAHIHPLAHRMMGLLILIVGGYAVLWIRCLYIQVWHHDWYCHRAQQQQTATWWQPVIRGTLYDRTGAVLVGPQPRLSAYTVPRTMDDATYDLWRAHLQTHFPERVESFCHARDRAFWYIQRQVTPAHKELLTTNWPEGVYFQEEASRSTPSACVHQILGGCDTQTTGLSGLELWYNTQLAGTPSRYMAYKDSRQHAIPHTPRCIHEGTPSTDIHTTLDLALSSYAYDALCTTVHDFESSAGAVVVLDPYTGDVLCATQHVHDDDGTSRNGTCREGLTPHHMAITQSFELGSVMKTFLALAAYQTNAVSDDELIDCGNTRQAIVNGFPVSTWKAAGLLSFFDVIRYSNNIGTAQVSRRIGTRLYDVYMQCGFGKLTGIDWPGEVAGFVNPPARWSRQSLNSLSFGYEIQATLLQLARAYGMLYTGFLATPRLNAKRPATRTDQQVADQQVTEPQVTDPRVSAHARQHTLAILRAIMQPHEQTWKRPDIHLYGKTGTARMLDDTGHYSPYKHLYTFAGLVVKPPSYARVIVACIKQARRHDLLASQVTLPLFMRIAWFMSVHDGL